MLFCFVNVSFTFQTVLRCQEAVGDLFVLQSEEKKVRVGNCVLVGWTRPCGHRLGMAIVPEPLKRQDLGSVTSGARIHIPSFPPDGSVPSFGSAQVTLSCRGFGGWGHGWQPRLPCTALESPSHSRPALILPHTSLPRPQTLQRATELRGACFLWAPLSPPSHPHPGLFDAAPAWAPFSRQHFII